MYVYTNWCIQTDFKNTCKFLWVVTNLSAHYGSYFPVKLIYAVPCFAQPFKPWSCELPASLLRWSEVPMLYFKRCCTSFSCVFSVVVFFVLAVTINISKILSSRHSNSSAFAPLSRVNEQHKALKFGVLKTLRFFFLWLVVKRVTKAKSFPSGILELFSRFCFF